MGGLILDLCFPLFYDLRRFFIDKIMMIHIQKCYYIYFEYINDHIRIYV